jgi:hypothetical protein
MENCARMPLPLPPRLTPIAALCLIAACVSSGPQIDPSTRLSTDPVLSGILASFAAGCIRNAPDFAEADVRAAFPANQPVLGPGMTFLVSGDGAGTCRVTVKGYGRDRPMPTVGDLNRLGEALAARLGGTLKPKSADTGAGSAQVMAGGRRYNVFAYVDGGGTLGLSVFD